jgi:DNA topoisomerase-3
MILQQPVEPEQMRKLLESGRTDLLTGFVSRRNGRKFKAFLVAGREGGVSFEFEARKPRAQSAPGAKQDAKAAKRTTAPAGVKAGAKPRRKAA